MGDSKVHGEGEEEVWTNVHLAKLEESSLHPHSDKHHGLGDGRSPGGVEGQKRLREM